MSAPEDKTRKEKRPSTSDYRIPAGSGWAGAWKVCAGIGALGFVGAAAGWATDPTRFAFSYLFAFFLALTVAFGSFFFILVERLCSAGWSVTVRRTAEFFAAGAWVFALLFVPVVLCMGTLYPWLRAEGDAGIVQPAHAAQTPGQAHEAPPSPTHEAPRPQHEGVAGTHDPMPASHAGAHAAPGVHGEEHADPEEAQEHEVLAKKRPWLNKLGWLARAVLYFIVWGWIGATFFRLSAGQDGSKDPKLTVRAQKLAPAATILFGFSLTGAAFDWLMSLLPTWYSTIFGVTVFAGSVVCMYATLIIVTMSLRAAGHLKNAVNVEHFHDLGKLLFGFLVFWAYTSFAQFMLIWYAAIPEETTFYHHRWDVGPWMIVSMVIVICHFVVPFFLLISRNEKRKLGFLRFGAAWLIVMHAVEMYWFVMPYYGGGEIVVSWIDLACLLGVSGVYLAAVFHRMTKHPLIPIGDPRLSRALTFENA